MMLQLEGDNYLICGESSDFANRQKSIFDKLDAVVVKQDPVSVDNSSNQKGAKFMKTDTGRLCTDVGDEDSTRKAKKSYTKHFKGKESIFKRPEAPPPPRFRQTMADFQRNPHKWVKYSLSDVSQDDMSDKSNTAAAMSFLNEIKARKQNCQEPMDVDSKIRFKKPGHSKKGTLGSQIIQISREDSPGEDGTSYFRGSKLIMPEYIVGEKKKKVHKKLTKDGSSENVKEIKLNHLTDFDEEEFE